MIPVDLANSVTKCTAKYLGVEYKEIICPLNCITSEYMLFIIITKLTSENQVIYKYTEHWRLNTVSNTNTQKLLKKGLLNYAPRFWHPSPMEIFAQITLYGSANQYAFPLS